MCEEKKINEQMEVLKVEKERLSIERNQLALAELKDTSIIPKSMNGKIALAVQFAKSPLLPEAYANKPENCFIALQFGEMMGFGNPMACFQNIYVVNGRPSASADSMLAACFNHPEFINYEQKGNEKESITTITRKFKSGVEKDFTRKHTIDMSADKIGKFPQWKSDPENMLKHRSDAKACRSAFPEIFSGIYIEDEAREIEVQDGNFNIIEKTNHADLKPQRKRKAEKEVEKEVEKPETVEETKAGYTDAQKRLIDAAFKAGVSEARLEMALRKEGKSIRELSDEEADVTARENF